MNKKEKLNYLLQIHFPEFIEKRKEIEKELSEKQNLFCICGFIASGLHEDGCRIFQNKVSDLTVKFLSHLIPKVTK
jgi:hypothetical protein